MTRGQEFAVPEGPGYQAAIRLGLSFEFDDFPIREIPAYVLP